MSGAPPLGRSGGVLPWSQTRFEVDPRPCVGCGLILVSWVLDCYARPAWTALHCIHHHARLPRPQVSQ